MNDPSPKRAKYLNPPIQEAVCEIHFPISQAFQPPDFERIKAAWKSDYPNQQIVAEKTFELEVRVDSFEAQSKEIGHKLVARSADEKSLAQLGPRFLAVNRLRPYVGWEEEFRRTILNRFKEVQAEYGLNAINRIGLRYINKIDVNQSPLNWSEWFGVSLPVPDRIPRQGGVFHSHYRQALTPNIEVVVNYGSLPSSSLTTASVLLDIEITWRGEGKIERLEDYLEEVHRPHRAIFEGYLLDKTRKLFQA